MLIFGRHHTAWPFVFRHHRNRLRIVWRYLRGTLTADDASDLFFDVRQAAGYAVLEMIDTEGAERHVEDCGYVLTDDVRDLIAEAVERVASKWSSSGDASGAAYDWVLDLVKEYAEDQGIELKEAA